MVMAYQASLQLVPDVALSPEVVTLGDTRWDGCIEVWKTSKMFGFDIETYPSCGSGLDPWRGDIRIISIGLKNGLALVADLGTVEDPANQEKLRQNGFFDVLQERLANPTVQVVGANLKFDQLWVLVKFGYKVRCIRDVMLMSQIYWAGLSYRHNLKAIATRLGFGVDKTEQTSDWWGDLTNNQLNYAAKDSLVVLKIWMKLGRMLHDEGLHGSALAECAANPAFVQMEYHGFPVDFDLLNDLLEKYRGASADLLKPFTDDFPGVNPDSPKQVVLAINEKYGLGVEGSDQDALAPHWGIPSIKALSLWRSLTTYIDYLQGCHNAFFDGAVRGSYRQSAPKGFGRSTCGEKSADQFPNVNLQNPPNPNNLPKELRALGLPPVRSIFRAPTGKKLLIADLSQAHARIAAEASQDPVLVDAYNNNKDVHCITASKLAALQGLGESWTPDAIGKWRKDKTHPDRDLAEKLRQAAKPTFYGSLNGQGPRTLKSTAKTTANVDMTDDEAKQAVQAWRDAYTGLYEFQKFIHDSGNSVSRRFPGLKETYGEVRGLSGRRIYFPKWGSDYRPDAPAAIKFTDAIAFYWTSTEADIVKASLGVLVELFDEHPEWGAYICNMAHDEINVICNEQFAEDVARNVLTVMQQAMKFFLKTIPVDDEGNHPSKLICQSWNEK